jgi:hypothetical protein
MVSQYTYMLFFPLRNEECMREIKGKRAICCMTHFLTSSCLVEKLIDAARGFNGVFFGSRVASYLVKRYPCVCYLNEDDYEFIRNLSQEYSEILPATLDADSHERVPEEEMKGLGKDCTLIHVQLKKKESLDNLDEIVRRVLFEQGLEPDEFEETVCARSIGESETSVYTLHRTLWVFCFGSGWVRAKSSCDFRGDPEYVLIHLEGGNIVRASKAIIDESQFILQQESKPLQNPRVSIQEYAAEIIAVCQCLDGYYEYIPGVGSDRGDDIILGPFNNPEFSIFGVSTVHRDLCRSGITQMIASGQLSLRTDLEYGYDLIDRLFSCKVELGRKVSENPLKRRRFDTVSVVDRSVPESTRFGRNTNRIQKHEAGFKCENVIYRSGVRGVAYIQRQQRGRKNNVCFTSPHSSMNPSTGMSGHRLKGILYTAKLSGLIALIPK